MPRWSFLNGSPFERWLSELQLAVAVDGCRTAIFIADIALFDSVEQNLRLAPKAIKTC